MTEFQWGAFAGAAVSSIAWIVIIYALGKRAAWSDERALTKAREKWERSTQE